ncbi:unnamed protein product [Trypanosoma congolense IL3000]|uniref:WGS project CAEQ00000000 data, annotated contig 1975 n=1 Tax=Trypanosoma congolense (strain IL3000) TaxID=1068625 RepID=F9WAH6_TRYCI|nr:unnamed protein product [Trypanosoma congolense IL3000]
MQSEGTKGSVVEVKRTAGKKAKRAAEDLDQGSVGGDRKRISFADGLSGDEGTDGQHKPMRYPNDKGEKRPSEFYELVDVVRYGERVEAPPVFDTVPSRDAAISRLASKLGHVPERGAKEVTRGKPSERLQLLSSVGGVGERKRLERLGLLAADSSTVAITKKQMLSKKEEMERLRMSVVEAYRRNKRASFDAKKDIDMHHKFPRFS